MQGKEEGGGRSGTPFEIEQPLSDEVGNQIPPALWATGGLEGTV